MMPYIDPDDVAWIAECGFRSEDANFGLCHAEVMDVRIAVQPQLGANYQTLLTVAQTCDRLGFSGFFMADHLMSMRDPLDALPGPTDVWTSLAGMARETAVSRR
jgi:alkanesulfonate monooxygenase SsuD/methylene tetrahydromethanopterin reductase-like flavin-dependent oxidoreductase (luciferase family)